MMNEAEVSFFENIKNVRNGRKVSLIQLLEDIKNGRWKDEVTQIRGIKDEGDRREEKSKILPCATISGTFSYRNGENLISHSGYICVDLDKIKNIEEMRNKLKIDALSYAVFVSVSGKGLAVLVKIDPEKHTESFLGLEKYYMDKYDYKIDKSCKDVSRARYVSYDPELFINTHSKNFKDYIKEPKSKEKSKVEVNNGRDEIKQQVEYVIKQIEERNILIGEIEIEEGLIKDKYNGWMRICFAFC